jgi:hypothetical protein
VDPDPDWIRIQRLWIRIRIGNPDPGARKPRNFSRKKALFSYLKKKNLPLKRYNYFKKKIWWITPVFFIKFDSNLDFKKIWERNCSVLAWIRIRIEQKCWIRIRINSIRIHNPGFITTHFYFWTNKKERNIYYLFAIGWNRWALFPWVCKLHLWDWGQDPELWTALNKTVRILQKLAALQI